MVVSGSTSDTRRAMRRGLTAPIAGEVDAAVGSVLGTAADD
jgi:hypothetical protein